MHIIYLKDLRSRETINISKFDRSLFIFIVFFLYYYYLILFFNYYFSFFSHNQTFIFLSTKAKFVFSQTPDNLIIAWVSNTKDSVIIKSVFSGLSSSFKLENEPINLLTLNKNGTLLATYASDV